MGGRYYITGVQIGMLRAFLQIAQDEFDQATYGGRRLEELLTKIEDNQHMCDASHPDWKLFVHAMFIEDRAVKPKVR